MLNNEIVARQSIGKSQDAVESATRRALIRAGWMVPVVLATSTSVFAAPPQSKRPFKKSPKLNIKSSKANEAAGSTQYGKKE